ncbi:MAG: hypothetical protein IPJ34_14905 [Myxococcales bacterium]|nr:hypothetical protein [Myxococcales bacterium]
MPTDAFDESSWMLGNMDGEIVGGPLSLNQVKSGLKDRSIVGTELLARAGSSAWRPIHEVLADPRSHISSSIPPPRTDRSHGAEWYVQVPGRTPDGPLATELVVLGLVERRIPANARVCLVGASGWSDIASVKEFTNAVRPLLAASASSSQAAQKSAPDRLKIVVIGALVSLVLLGIVLLVVLW